ncbi:MAG: deoxynucleoside kinase [Flavobacteriales bacterium]|nr:deoxynucleoside kinase [Flavobacteriales bacterium]MBK6946556.1 deoxynucleoside kinase [Flavobacteriales bacterium]MBP9138402.1 deoxynucleoside kinase [Flavobacteriales bacterium]HQV52202.1 deoxynucleoside kinase [Flavobacteriales bacterium]HQX30477.1 deoxynucleoside kinase [Flavobacteriales bacterium]
MEVKRSALPYTYIAVEGLIGAGKTTLAKRLALEWSGRLVLEEFDDNPFLPRFYQEPDRYAFSVELSFLAQRYHQLKRITEQDLFTECTVADYSLGKSLVFASVTLPTDEAALFKDLYSIMYKDLPKPELVVYLHLSMDRVRERIRTRGRSYEQQISVDYLDRLQERYLDHLQKYSVQSALVVDLGGSDLLKDIDAYERFVELLLEPRATGYSVVTL